MGPMILKLKFGLEDFVATALIFRKLIRYTMWATRKAANPNKKNGIAVELPLPKSKTSPSHEKTNANSSHFFMVLCALFKAKMRYTAKDGMINTLLTASARLHAKIPLRRFIKETVQNRSKDALIARSFFIK